MNLAVWVKGERGEKCLEALARTRHRVSALVFHPRAARAAYWKKRFGAVLFAPSDPNGAAFRRALKKIKADVFVLAGYGMILKKPVLSMPKRMTINLHGGKLPSHRGSSPMNWALIRGDRSFALSVIRVDTGIDSGEILLEKSFPIKPDATITDLHRIAQAWFPKMLVQTLDKIEKGRLRAKKQKGKSGYFPLRFPADGFVLWDQLTASQVHNRIRALTDPYPCAFTYYGGKKILLPASELSRRSIFGEPGRVYRTGASGMLVAAKDRCLWVRGRFENGGAAKLPRYARLATLGAAVEAWQKLLSGEKA